MARRHPAGAGILVAVVVLAAASAFLPKVLHKMPDFEVYWLAGARIVSAEPLYRTSDQHYQHKYFPVFAMLMIPWARLPLTAAKILWFYTSIAAIAALVALSVALLPRRKLPPLTLAVVTTLVLLKFFAHELSLGQCNAWMALCASAAFGCMTRGRPALAGVLFALSVAVKPYTIVLLPYLAIKRRFVTAGVFFACLAVALVAPAVIYGAAGNAAQLGGWLQTVAASTPANLLNQDNVSIWSLYVKWLGSGPLAFDLAAGTIVLLAVCYLMVLRRGAALVDGEYLEVAVLLALLPLVSPQGWDYVLLIAAPAVVLFVNEFRGLPVALRVVSGAAVAVMALSVFDLMGRRAYVAFMSVSTITVCALLMLTPLVYLRMRRIA